MKFLLLAPGGFLGSAVAIIVTYTVAQVTHFDVEVKDVLTFGLTFGGIVGTVGMLLWKQSVNISKEVGELKGAVANMAPCRCAEVKEEVEKWLAIIRNDMQTRLTDIELRIQKRVKEKLDEFEQQIRYIHEHHKERS